MALALMICKGLPEGRMRKLWIIMGLLCVGCASKPTSDRNTIAPQMGYIDKPAYAMVFQHPILADMEPGFYSREGLSPGAFVAFEESETTYFEIRTDDRLRNSNDGWMYRRAFMQRFGTSFR